MTAAHELHDRQAIRDYAMILVMAHDQTGGNAVETTTLSPRDARIFELRATGLTLAEIGREVGLSGTRVSRILGSTGTTTTARTPKRTYACGCCGRKLKTDRYVYSSYTGNRYCWPGEGCARW